MKKSILALTMFLCTFTLFAQNEIDALRYSQRYYEGTARSVAMGNAFTALGGDIGALSINPAASGVYRHSEFSLTPALTNTAETITYTDITNRENRTRFGLSNAGYVGVINTGRQNSGLISYSLSLTANKTNNYTSRSFASGTESSSSWTASLAAGTDGIPYDKLEIRDDYNPFYSLGSGRWRSILAYDTYLLENIDYDDMYIGATENIDPISGDLVLGGPVNQRFFHESIGNTTEYTFNFGSNISNKLFFGVNLTLSSVWYSSIQTYSEKAQNPNMFQTLFSNFTHRYEQSTSGTGFNAKIGVIYLPIDGLRIGAAISTPTWLYMVDKWNEDMTTEFTDAIYYSDSPIGEFQYRLRTPFHYNLGIAYTVGNFGLLSFDYESINYSNIKMVDLDRNDTFDEANRYIRKYYKNTHNIRVGFEVKPVSNIAIRGGYNYYDTPDVDFNLSRHIASVGLGYTGKSGFFADIAYQGMVNKDQYEMQFYDDYGNPADPYKAPIASGSAGWWKLFLTLGFKF